MKKTFQVYARMSKRASVCTELSSSGTGQNPFHNRLFRRKEVFDMVKYEKARMEVIEFESEDVITTSGCNGTDVSVGGWGCGNKGSSCWDYELE